MTRQLAVFNRRQEFFKQEKICQEQFLRQQDLNIITLSMLSDTTTAEPVINTCPIKSNLTNGDYNVKKQAKDILHLSFYDHNEENISTCDKYKDGQELHSSPIQNPCKKHSGTTKSTMNDKIPKQRMGKTVAKCSCITVSPQLCHNITGFKDSTPSPRYIMCHKNAEECLWFDTTEDEYSSEEEEQMTMSTQYK